MTTTEDLTKPVEDSVAKINDEVAVGEDLEFQEKWWRFEHTVWLFFLLLLVLDLLGVFGRGPLAKTRKTSPDGSFQVEYERIERTGTPSFMRVSFGPGAIQNSQLRLYVSESLVKELGTQRVIPAPLTTDVGNGGLTYTFPASQLPAAVEFALQPSAPGYFHFDLQVPGRQPVHANVAVMP